MLEQARRRRTACCRAWQGAKRRPRRLTALVQQWQDVAAEFPPEIAAAMLPPEVKEKGKGKSSREAPLPADLSDGERALLKLISADEAAHIDALSESSGMAVAELSGVLLGLEMRDLVRQLPGKCFVRKL
jgi:DNA processing protein